NECIEALVDIHYIGHQMGGTSRKVGRPCVHSSRMCFQSTDHARFQVVNSTERAPAQSATSASAYQTQCIQVMFFSRFCLLFFQQELSVVWNTNIPNSVKDNWETYCCLTT